jgi:hypothetical protein
MLLVFLIAAQCKFDHSLRSCSIQTEKEVHMLRKCISVLFVIALTLVFFHSNLYAKDLIFSDNFESGNLNAWDAKKIGFGDLSVTKTAALEGARGLRVRIDGNTPICVIDDSPSSEPSYQAKFLFDPNSIRMAYRDSHVIFLGQDLRAVFVAALRVEFRIMAPGYQLRAGAKVDNLTWVNTDWFTIMDGLHEVEVEWDASQSAGMDNGQLAFIVDRKYKAYLTGLDNDTFRIDRVRLGAVSGIDTTTRGVYFFDSFESFN